VKGKTTGDRGNPGATSELQLSRRPLAKFVSAGAGERKLAGHEVQKKVDTDQKVPFTTTTREKGVWSACRPGKRALY